MDKSPRSWAKINGWEGEGDWKWRLTLRAKSWKSLRGHYLPHSLADQCRDKPKNRHFETKLNQTTFPSSLYQVWLPLFSSLRQGQVSDPPSTRALPQATSEPRTVWPQDGIFVTAVTLVPGEGTGSEPGPRQSLTQPLPVAQGWAFEFSIRYLQPARWLTQALCWGSVLHINKGIPESHSPRLWAPQSDL